MFKMNESKFNENKYESTKFLENKELIDDLQNVLNTESKKISSNAKENFQFDLVNDKNILKKFCAYSKINQELYILLKSKINRIFSYSLITYSLETSNLKSHKYLKFCFTQTQTSQSSGKRNIDPNADFLNFDIKEIYIHPKNHNQLCFFGDEFLAFIQDLKEFSKNSNPNLRENLSMIKIFHTSKYEKELKQSFSQIDKNPTTPSNNFKKFKFSNFSNYFGVLLRDNTFRFYNINSGITQTVLNFSNTSTSTKTCANSIVDFAFPPISNFSWQNFSIVFLDSSGSLSYVCPIFPENFFLSENILNQMNKFQKSLRIIEDSNENLLNENIIYHLGSSAVDMGDFGEVYMNSNFTKKEIRNENNLDKKTNNLHVKIDDYLKNFNRSLNPVNLVTIDKRRITDVLAIQENFPNKKISYSQLHIVNSSPMTILRVSEKNSIDVIVCNEEISPNRNKFSIGDKLEQKERLCFIIETIRFDLFEGCENIPQLNFFQNPTENENNFSSNYFYDEKNSITVSILNDIYVIEFPYLQRLSYYIQNYNGKDDLNIGELKSEVKEVTSFDYQNYFSQSPGQGSGKGVTSQPTSKSKLPYGYFCLEKIANKFLLISVCLEDKNLKTKEAKFFVKEIDSLDNMNIVQISNTEDSLNHNHRNQFSQNLNEFIQAFQNNLEKFDTNFKSRENPYLDMGKVESMIKTTLFKIKPQSHSDKSNREATTESEKSIKNYFSSIRDKEIEIDEKNLELFSSSSSFDDLEEYIKIQIEEIFRFYDRILSQESFAKKEKFQILTNVLEKIDYTNIDKMKSDIISERELIERNKTDVIKKKKLIEDKIKNVEEKLKRIASKDPRIIERHIILKNVFDNNLREANNLKKTSEEVKSELNKILFEEFSKNEPILKEKLNPKMIKRELIEKQISFGENLKKLERENLNSLNKLR